MKLSVSIAVILLALLAIVTSVPTISYAQKLSSAATAGLTTVESSLANNTYTWTLTNNSGFPSDSTIGYDILVWSLQPFGVPGPVSWTAPAGWEWQANGQNPAFQIAQSSQKYYSDPAIAPGQSAVFTYTFESGSPLVNGSGSNAAGSLFLTHVAAVESQPSAQGAGLQWTPSSVSGLGATWHDASTSGLQQGPPVPEIPGALSLIIGALWLVTCMLRARRRASVAGARFAAEIKF